MALLGREAILAASDQTRQAVLVPEWGGEVMVRSITAGERDRFEAGSVVGAGKQRRTNMVNLRARLCALCICDEAGARLFSDKDVEQLGMKSAAALGRVFDAACELNGFSAEDIEDLEKNSDGGLSDSSSSGSP